MVCSNRKRAVAVVHGVRPPMLAGAAPAIPSYRAIFTDTPAELVESGHLRVHVEHVFRLAEAAQAHERLTGRTKGKIVLTL